MIVNLDIHINNILKDLKLREHSAMKFAAWLDNILLFVFYFFIVWFMVKGEWTIALCIFVAQTLWKISMALQDITMAVNLNCALNSLKKKDHVDD